MMYLILMEVDQSAYPKDNKEKMKMMASFLEIGKKDLDSGELKMGGMSPDGHSGFVISNQDAKTIYTKAQVLAPYTKLTVMPMLSLDETMDAIKEMQQ